jgi:hypothetical protein
MADPAAEGNPMSAIGPVELVHNSGRSRRRQRLTVTISAVAVAGALVGGLVLANHAPSAAQPGTANALVAAAAKAPATTTVKAPATQARATPVRSVVIPQPAGPKSTATPAAIVYRLQQLLPAGRTSGFGRSSDGALFGQISLDKGHGPSMMRMNIGTGGPLTPEGCKSGSDFTVTCLILPSGAAVQVTRISDNCIQSLVVAVDHGNGVVVQLDVATCGQWNGKTNPPCDLALTQAQAIAIAADPSWGLQMDSALVTAAHQRFGHLPTFS